MKIQEAKKKYKKYWKQMQKHMNGITVSIDENGDTDIPERDLEMAYELVTKGETMIQWD